MKATELIAKLQALVAEHGGDVQAVMHDREWMEYWTIKNVTVEAVVHAGTGGTYRPARDKRPHARVLLLDA
jgi:hypothetical protein